MNQKTGFLLLLFLALFIRMYQTPKISYLCDFDEFSSVQTISGVYSDKVPEGNWFSTSDPVFTGFSASVHNLARENGNNQIFNAALTLWSRIAGLSDMSLRFFCILMDMLSMGVIMMLGKLIAAAPRNILLFLFLFAIYPVLVFYSESIRGYSFTTFFSLSSVFLTLKIYRNPKFLHVGLFFLCLIGMVFGHFLSYYIAGVLFLFAMMQWKKNRIASIRVMACIVFTGLLSVGYMVSNSSGIANMQEKSKRYADRDHHKTELTSEGTKELSYTKIFLLTGFQYAIKYYCGILALVGFANVLGLTLIPLMLFSVLLIIPAYILFSQRKIIGQEPTLQLFWLLAIGGNVSGFLIAFVSGHMTGLGVKYSMFSIPFFLGALALFGEFTVAKRSIILLLTLICGISNISIIQAKGQKAIPVKMNGHALGLKAADMQKYRATLASEMNLQKGDSLILTSKEDMVFLYHLFPPEMKDHAFLIDRQRVGLSIQNGAVKRTIDFQTQIPD